MPLFSSLVWAFAAAGCGGGSAAAEPPKDAGTDAKPDAAAHTDAGHDARADARDVHDSASGHDAEAAAPAKIKWNPGHYMASQSIVYASGSILASEMDNLNHQDAFVGYRMLITWAALEPTLGSYDFSLIDATLAQLKTAYDQPKRLVVVVLPGAFTRSAPGTDDYSIIPEYIQSDSAYGPSPVAGSYGWWGGTGNGNTYSACLYRPAVMARWTLLHQALGKKYDAEPSFEAIMFQEDSWEIGAASTNGAPDYSDSAMVPQYKALLTATLAAFPTTSVVFENSYMGAATPAQEFEQWMVENRVAPGAADTLGEAYFTAHGGSPNGWGLEAYFGITASGSTWTGSDMRPVARAMLDVEGPDLGAYGFSGYAPLDIITAVNAHYQASHLFWTYLPVNASTPVASQWPQLSATCAANPLTHTAYPSNYP